MTGPETTTPADSEEYVVEVENLVAEYGRHRVLDGVCLRIPKSKITVILGGSGSGKTTLLRHLIGLQQPAGGRIIFKGRPMDLLDPKSEMEIRRRMGVLFQGGALFNSLSVAENVALPLREHTRLDSSVITIITRMKLESVGLAGFEYLMPDQLSGGMKKRAGLARALAMDPEVLFVDEPSAGLDPITAAGLDRLLINLKETFNMTIIVVTHEIPSLYMIADQVCMIDRGRVLFSGPLDEFKKSAHPRIRQFLDREPDEIRVDPMRYLDVLTKGV